MKVIRVVCIKFYIYVLLKVILFSLFQDAIDILDIINDVLNVDPDKLKKSQNDGSATNRYANV